MEQIFLNIESSVHAAYNMRILIQSPKKNSNKKQRGSSSGKDCAP